MLIAKEFPHTGYGENKDLKQRSYPLTFKHHFFKVYRAVDKNTQAQTGNKVGFWAPAGNPVSKNMKVMSESKAKKEQDIWDTRKKYAYL